MLGTLPARRDHDGHARGRQRVATKGEHVTETDTSASSSTTEETEPAWFSEARSLHSQGVEDTAIAKAVHKRVNDVRKLIKRDAEAAEAAKAETPTEPTEPASPPAADPPAGAPPVAGPTAPADPAGAPVQAATTVTAEQAERQRQLAGDSSGDGEPQAELFPAGSIEGDGYSLRSVGKAGEPVTEITVAMTGGEVPMPHGSGLLDPHKEGMLLVTYECTDGGRPIPIREGERGEKKIVGWKTRQQVRPVYIERVKGEEGVIEGHFAALLEADASRAGALLDRLIVRAGRSLNK